MEGKETQYYTGGKTGSQENWMVSRAVLQYITVSSTQIQKMFTGQFPFRKDSWLSQQSSYKYIKQVAELKFGMTLQ